MSRAKVWSEEVEEIYRFQQAGYRDESEYKAFNPDQDVRFFITLLIPLDIPNNSKEITL